MIAAEYAAPETDSGHIKAFGRASDIWSVGCIALRIAAGTSIKRLRLATKDLAEGPSTAPKRKASGTDVIAATKAQFVARCDAAIKREMEVRYLHDIVAMIVYARS